MVGKKWGKEVLRPPIVAAPTSWKLPTLSARGRTKASRRTVYGDRSASAGHGSHVQAVPRRLCRLGQHTGRRHDEEVKAKVLAVRNEPGVSIASVALADGLNATW